MLQTALLLIAGSVHCTMMSQTSGYSVTEEAATTSGVQLQRIESHRYTTSLFV